MIALKRTDRLNSLLKEVISDVIKNDVKNPHLSSLISITGVDITKDLHYAKVYVSVIGDGEVKKNTLAILRHSAGYISVQASRQVVMRYFPALNFILDDSLEKQMHIETLIAEIEEKRKSRKEKS